MDLICDEDGQLTLIQVNSGLSRTPDISYLLARNAAFDFVQKLSGVKSPSEFVELSTEHARQQLESLTDQTKKLATLAQHVTLATAEPLKTGVAKAFNHAA